MAKQSVVRRNNKRLVLVQKYKEKRELLKKQIKDKNIDISTKMNIVFKLSKLPRDSARCRYKNRCLITGRGRGITFYKEFPFNRVKIREMALQGLLPGVTKSSW